MSIVSFSISGRVPSKKNARINTRSGRSFPSKKYTEWHKGAMLQMVVQDVPKIAIEETVIIDIDVYFPDRRKADITNKVESIMDLMVDYGLLLDDNWKVVPKLVLTGQYDKELPRVDVKIIY